MTAQCSKQSNALSSLVVKLYWKYQIDVMLTCQCIITFSRDRLKRISSTVQGKNKKRVQDWNRHDQQYKNTTTWKLFSNSFQSSPAYCFKKLENGYPHLELWPIMVQIDDSTAGKPIFSQWALPRSCKMSMMIVMWLIIIIHNIILYCVGETQCTGTLNIWHGFNDVTVQATMLRVK